jgi:hypothetical protein
MPEAFVGAEGGERKRDFDGDDLDLTADGADDADFVDP